MAGETDIPDNNLKGTPGQIKVTGDEVAGDGANYRDETVDLRGGIITHVHKDGLSFVDRGDANSWDFEATDFTTDATWRELDLSSIVPKTAKVVLLHTVVLDDAINSYMLFRRKGNSYEMNRGQVRTQVANQYNEADLIIPIGSDGKIEYKAANVAFSEIVLHVKGWWQ